jgi:hypothetical protein
MFLSTVHVSVWLVLSLYVRAPANLYQWVKGVDVCLDHLDSSSHGSKLRFLFSF